MSGEVAAVAAVGQRFDWRQGVVERLSDEELAGPVSIDVSGGNGQMIVASRVVQDIGLLHGELFIDFEDAEFCL